MIMGNKSKGAEILALQRQNEYIKKQLTAARQTLQEQEKALSGLQALMDAILYAVAKRHGKEEGAGAWVLELPSGDVTQALSGGGRISARKGENGEYVIHAAERKEQADGTDGN